MNNYKIVGELYLSSIDDSELLKRQLYSDLQKFRKDSFEPNERIVINLGDHDYYYKSQLGMKLEVVQRIVDAVDISNCFIRILTTNRNITKELELASKISRDPDNMFEFEILEGEFNYIKDGKSTTFNNYVYGTSVPIRIGLDKLTDREKYLLMESKTFCMYPWIHMNASPDGEAMPCCLWDYNEKMGSVKEHTMPELWNSEQWKKLRRDMLNDEPTPGCNRCYNEERSGFFSPRQSANKHQGHQIKRVSETKEDGHLDRFEITYWDIRFSNLCNLSCRSCGHIFSSSWYQDQVKLAGPEWGKKNKALFWAGKHETDMLEQLMEHIDHVEQIYFAGGEPLMMDEHYQILEELERRKKFHVRLVYNTNFTKTKLKDRYVFDYWRKFNTVGVGASLDAMGPRAEYIRKGTKWQDVEENRRMMLEICPNVDFYISPTLSIFNALHIPDFHRDWVERGLLNPQDLNINPLQDPYWMRVDIAPPEYRKKIREKIEKHLEWLRPIDKLSRATQGFVSALNMLDNDYDPKNLEIFWEKTKKLDNIRNENILDVLPELYEIRINN